MRNDLLSPYCSPDRACELLEKYGFAGPGAVKEAVRALYERAAIMPMVRRVNDLLSSPLQRESDLENFDHLKPISQESAVS